MMKNFIVDLYNNGIPAGELIGEYGIGSSTLYKWIKQYSSIRTEGGTITTNKQLQDLKKQLLKLQQENEILKKEEVNVRKYKTFEEAKISIFEFIKAWYNDKRIHSTLGYITQNEKYNNYVSNLAAI